MQFWLILLTPDAAREFAFSLEPAVLLLQAMKIQFGSCRGRQEDVMNGLPDLLKSVSSKRRPKVAVAWGNFAGRAAQW